MWINSQAKQEAIVNHYMHLVPLISAKASLGLFPEYLVSDAPTRTKASNQGLLANRRIIHAMLKFRE
jgi:hypothetical protein